MLKKALVAALMGMCSLAQAEYYRLDAMYTGFTDINGQFQADKQLRLYALLEDTNGDGAFTVGEVRSFRFDGVVIGPAVMVPGGCGGNDEWYSGSYCMSGFSYTPGGTPTFAASISYRDFDASQTTAVTSGGSYYSVLSYSSDAGSYWYYDWGWTPQTQVTLRLSPTDAPVPVPEPATYAMLGAGLLAVGAFARRRRG